MLNWLIERWEFVREWASERRILLWHGALSLLSLVAFLWALEWAWLYPLFERLGGCWWLWPGLVLLLALAYLGFGIWAHRKSGLPRFFPVVAAPVPPAVFLAALWWSWLAAPEWSPMQTLGAVVLLALAAAVNAGGYVAYAELWCRRWSRATVDTLLDTLPGEDVGRGIQGADLWRAHFFNHVKTNDAWGSGHCLDVLAAAFAVRKQRLLALPGLAEPEYGICLALGDALDRYLAQRWAPNVLAAAQRQEWVLDLQRQLLTLWLAAPGEQRGRYEPHGRRWLDAFRSNADSNRYRIFLVYCFELAQGADPAAGVHAVVAHYESLPRTGADDPSDAKQRLICRQTWLALAGERIGAQPCFDAWMAMQRGVEGLGPCDGLAAGLTVDPAAVLARRFLIHYYRQWAAGTHRDWRQGLEAAVTL
jgi:hypothetical protein